jgi:hypothetical protein
MSNPRDPDRDHPLDSGRDHTHATENDNLKPDRPPQAATTPEGSEGSTQSDKLRTDPSSGAQ